MTKVNTLTTPKNCQLGNMPAGIARYQEIENALTLALTYLRLENYQGSLFLTMAQARRASTLLKQACEQAKNGGAQ